MSQKLFFISLFSSIFILLNSQNSRSTISYTEAPFFHGVASGDPLSNKVMIWTKITPYSGATSEIDVYWQIATDTAFLNVVNFGKVKTDTSKNFTVKIDVCGLLPNTYYYYVFKAFGNNSIIGRTKTSPVGNNSEVRYALVHGTNYEHGFFNGYESMAGRNDLDAILHLGDYFYEYHSGGFSSTIITDDWNRTISPSHEVFTLDDYRARHSHYKLDNQLQLAHQMHPFITIWDDHEQANDSYKDGAENHNPSTEGSWIDRKISSAQAYDEWMPIRTDTMSNSKIWRKLRYGNLLDLILLDTRMWERDFQDMSLTDDPNHLIMAQDQFDWLKQELLDTTTEWKIIGNQVMFSPLEMMGFPVNSDQWDGYNYQRQLLIDFISINNIKNVVFLTGDIHSAWFSEIENSSGTNIATEFVGTSVTSPGLDVIEVALGNIPSWLLASLGGSVTAVIKFFNSHMKYINVEDHGYVVITVNNSKVQADNIHIEREDTNYTEDYASSWYTPINTSSMLEATSYITPNPGPIKPPLEPRQNISFALFQDTIYASVNENQILNNCIVNVSNICPNVNTSIVQNATYGNAVITDFCYEFQAITNYYGSQYFSVEICSNTSPAICDTVVVAVEINGINDVVTYDYNFYNDSILTDCVSFNDLTSNIDSFIIIGGTSGTFFINTSSCFTFEADSNYSGQDQITVIACDDNGICDTIIINLLINGYSTTQIVNLYGEDYELLNNCLAYDDLQGNIINNSEMYSGINGAIYVYNDSCISYQSNYLFNGIDTAIIYACDDFVPQKCDTIIYYMHITHQVDTSDSTIAIKEIVNNEFSILGIFPNPFDREIIVQYYQFVPSELLLILYDISGKIIFKETIKDKSIGLKYAKLNTEQLARGNYLFEIKNDKFSYVKRLIK